MFYTSILLILLISIILLVNHWSQNKGIVFLVFGILFSSIRIITFFLVNIKSDFDVFALLFLHTDPLVCLIAPSFLFYLRTLIYAKIVFKPSMLLHLLPALMVLINTLPFYGVPFEEKVKFVTLLVTTDSVDVDNFQHLLFSYKLQKLIPPLISVSYFVFFLVLGPKIKQEGNVYIRKKVNLVINRIMTIVGINILPAVLLIAYSTYQASLAAHKFSFAFTNEAFRDNHYFYLLTLVLPISFFLSPTLLYGDSTGQNRLTYFIDGLKNLVKSENSGSLKPGLKSEDLDRILSFMEDTKPYLKDNFSLHDISRAINIPHARVSNCFTKQLKISFPIYRNRLRVQHATSLLRDGAHLHMSIEGIALNSGFKSVSTFYLAFKAEYGMTPIDWIRENL